MRLRHLILATAALALPGMAAAKPVDHYTASAGGIKIEISAPRADIIRVRAGEGSLPEDASWAVLPQARETRVPLQISDKGDVTEIRTSQLIVRVDDKSLAITITDPGLLAQLRQAADVVELKDPDGNVLGRFSAEGLGRLPPGVKSPFTPEQMAERRKQRTGRPLKDILRDLEARG